VLWNSRSSRPFSINQGVKQGAILSPLLYTIYLNDLLIELQQSNLGVKIGDIYCGAPAYTDDLALVASTPEELQKTLDNGHAYSNNWRYRLKASKSKIMIFGEWPTPGDSGGVYSPWYHQILQRTATARTSCQISTARSSFFALNRAGSRFGCIHPVTSMCLYSNHLSPLYAVWM